MHSNKAARWLARARPGVQTTYRARNGAVTSGEVTVHVSPVVSLVQDKQRFIARVDAGRSFGGRPVRVQQLRGGGWVDVGKIVLGRRSAKAFARRGIRPGAKLRLVLPAAPGYLRALSEPLTVR